jgi:hypothetical protein
VGFLILFFKQNHTIFGAKCQAENTVTRANPNYAYQNSANSAGSVYLSGDEEEIAAMKPGSEWTKFDATGKVVQDATEVTKKSGSICCRYDDRFALQI